MNSQLVGTVDEENVSDLYCQLLDCWNERNADALAALFNDNGSVVGFDGSVMNGREEIESTLGQIFADHPTAAYVGKIREVRSLAPGAVLLRAVAGMVPPGKHEINSAANSIQTVVATQQDSQWRIALFHNTPAQFHGRPELSKALTEELQQLL